MISYSNDNFAILTVPLTGGCNWQFVGQDGGLRARPMFSSLRLSADDDDLDENKLS